MGPLQKVLLEEAEKNGGKLSNAQWRRILAHEGFGKPKSIKSLESQGIICVTVQEGLVLLKNPLRGRKPGKVEILKEILTRHFQKEATEEEIDRAARECAKAI